MQCHLYISKQQHSRVLLHTAQETIKFDLKIHTYLRRVGCSPRITNAVVALNCST